RHADVAMLDSLVSMLSYDALDHLNSGRKVTRHGTAHAHIVPWQAFQTSDGYVVVAARDEKFWRNLCDAIGRADLKNDPLTSDNAARVASREYLNPILSEAFLTKTKSEWLTILDEFDIPNAPVNDIGDVFEDPHVQARGMIRSYEHPTIGDVRYPPSPVKFSDWDSPNEPAPMLGEHTVEVLGGKLGLEESAVRSLASEGVVKVWPEQE
ncbi:MAG: CoA transferase, partial [Acidimicrobiia bacterium]|nr:CoA transferase [Acidimicrobiia bacterium]